MLTWKQRLTRRVESLVELEPEQQARLLDLLADQIGSVMGSTSDSAYKTLEFMLKLLRQHDSRMRETPNHAQFQVILTMLHAQTRRKHEDKKWRQFKDKMRRLGVLPALESASDGYTNEQVVIDKLRSAGFSKRGAKYRLNMLYRNSILEDPHEDSFNPRIGPPMTKLTKEGARLFEELRGNPHRE